VLRPVCQDKERTQKCVLPCTPLAVVKILESLKVYDESLALGSRLRGKKITVINRSEVVGRPLAALLVNDGATVWSVDIDSVYLMEHQRMSKVESAVEDLCRQSDVIVLGVPSPNYKLSTECIAEGTVVINVASFKNVNVEELSKIQGVKFVSAVGKVTVALLERNLLRLYQNFHSPVVDIDADGNTWDGEPGQLKRLPSERQSQLNHSPPVPTAHPKLPLELATLLLSVISTTTILFCAWKLTKLSPA